MAAYRVVLFAVLVSLVASDSHGSNSYDLQELFRMFQQSQQTTTQRPASYNPLQNNDPRVAHTDFLVGRFDLASGSRCTTQECRTLASQLQKMIVNYNLKVMHYISDYFPMQHFYYHYTPLHFKSIDVVVITVYYWIPPTAENTTTSTSRPTTSSGPSNRPGGSSTTSRPNTQPPATTTTTSTASPTTTSSTTTPTSGSTTSSTGTTGYSYVCSFENNNNPLCGAVQDSTDVFNWTRHSGGTPSSGTGPDGAYAGTYYMYIEATNPRERGDTARLLLPLNTAGAGTVCVRFYYHMQGQHMGTLNVIRSTSSGDTTNIWSRSGETDPAGWFSASAQTSLGTGDRLIFEGIRGTEYQADIAIDDVTVGNDLSGCSSK